MIIYVFIVKYLFRNIKVYRIVFQIVFLSVFLDFIVYITLVSYYVDVSD